MPFKIYKLSKRVYALTAMTAALAMLMAGCGGSDTSSSSSTKASGSEPTAGFPQDWQGAYPMPAKDKAYNNPQDADNVKDGGELTLATTYTPNWNNFNVDGNTGYMNELWAWYMPNLFTMDLKGDITWNADFITKAEVTSKDPLVVTYDINEKAKWNDGADIDWTAFKATWEIMNGTNDAYSPASTDGFKDIASVEQGSSAKQAVVTYSKPFYPWQSVFTSLYNPEATDPDVYSKGWIDNAHSEWGAGPYKVTKSDQNEAVFERNENWWGTKPKLDKVTYKYMEDTAQLNAFKNAEIDAVEFASNNSLQTIKDRKDIQVRLGYSKKTNVLMYNGKSDALKDINVRKAITYALDTETMTKVHYQGLNWTPGAPGSELFPVFQEGYEDNRPAAVKKGVNVAAAGKALEASGYKKGDDGYYAKGGKTLSVRYTYFGDAATGTAMAKAYQQMGKKAGIKIELDNRDGSKFSDTVTGGDYEVLPMAWEAPSPYSQVNVNQLYGSKSDSNYSYVGNAEVDKLADMPGTIEDQLEAVKAANKAEAAAFELYGTVPLDVPPDFTAVTKGLANYGPAGFTSLDPLTIGWQK